MSSIDDKLNEVLNIVPELLMYQKFLVEENAQK